MTRRARPTHAPAFKAKVALARHQGREDAGRVGAAQTQITAWKAQVMEGVAGIFGSGYAGLR